MHWKSGIFVFVIVSSCQEGAELSTVAAAGEIACRWQAFEDLLVEDQAATYDEEQMLSIAEQQEDLKCLQDIMERQYIAHHYYLSEEGVNLAEQMRSLSSTLGKEQSIAGFVDQILKVHAKAYDAHLKYQLVSESQEYFSKRLPSFHIYYIDQSYVKKGNAFANGADLVHSCDGFYPQLTYRNGSLSWYFVGQSMNRLTHARCLTNEGPEELPVRSYELDELDAPDSAQLLGQFHYRELMPGLLYVRLPEMTPGVSSAQQELLTLISAEGFSMDILFDVRQNGGGDDDYVEDLARALTAKHQTIPNPLATDIMSQFSIASSLNMLVTWRDALNRQQDDEALERLDSWVEILHALKDQLDEQGVGFEDKLIQTETPGEVSKGTREKKFQGHVYLLADKGCASSCESMHEYLGRLEHFTVLGSHSMGALKFGNIGHLFLPNSRVRVQTGWRGFFHYEGGGEEGLGYTPDIYLLNDNQDDLDAAIEYLQTGVSASGFSGAVSRGP